MKKGSKHTEEAKQKLRDNAKVNLNYGTSGKHLSKKTKKKIALSLTGENNSRFNKSYEEIYGKTKATKIKNKQVAAWTDEKRKIFSVTQIGKTLEDKYGVVKANNIKKRISKNNAKYFLGKSRSKETKEKMSLKHKGKKLSKKTREKISKNNSRYWLGKHLSTDTRKKISFAQLGKSFEEKYGKKNADKIKTKISNSMKGKLNHFYGKHHSQNTCLKLSNSIRGRKSPIKGRQFPKMQYPKMGWRTSRKNQIFPLKDTKIEVKIQNFLKELKIDFFTHQYIKEIEHGYQCDILVPSMNLVIECDGDYWHKYPIGKEIDHIRTKELLEKGFKVLRLWEFEIRSMNISKFAQHISEVKGGVIKMTEQTLADKEEVVEEEDDEDEIEEFVDD